MADETYFLSCTAEIQKTRAFTVRELEALGFTVLPSRANFVFAKSDRIPGGDLYRRLKADGILVRHFDAPRIEDYCRITVGSREQMETLVTGVKKILEV